MSFAPSSDLRSIAPFPSRCRRAGTTVAHSCARGASVTPTVRLIDLGIDPKRGVFGGYWRVSAPKIITDLLTFVKGEDTISLSGFGEVKISKADEELLRKSAVALLAGGSESSVDNTARMVNLADAIGFIDRGA